MTSLTAERSLRTERWKSWQGILFFGGLLFLLNLLGAFWIEPYSGSCMFVLMAYFQAMIIILPVLLIKRFGVATAVYLPYALLGVGFEFYFEWVVARVLLSPWYAVLWRLLGSLNGFLGDVINRFLPRHIPERWRAITLGVVLELATFTLTRWGLTSF